MQGLVMGFTDVFLVLTFLFLAMAWRDPVDPPAACRRGEREAGIDAVVIAWPLTLLSEESGDRAEPHRDDLRRWRPGFGFAFASVRDPICYET